MDSLTTLEAINIKFSALENYVDFLSESTHKKIQALEAKNAELELELETVKQDLESVEADLDNRVTELEQ